MRAKALSEGSMLNFFKYHEETLNEREKIEGVDPLKILELVNREVGRWEDVERDGFELNMRTDDYTYFIRWKGSEYNEDLPAMRANYRFKNCDDPELILKAFSAGRPEWNHGTFSIIEDFDAYRTENVVV